MKENENTEQERLTRQETPTNEMRWHRPVAVTALSYCLQQRWSIRIFMNGEPCGALSEWRDVPYVIGD